MTLGSNILKSSFVRGAVLGLGSVAGTISLGGLVVFLAYAHLISLSAHQLVFV